jgi:hypothetical protein
LFAALPVPGDNPVGKAARNALISRLKGAIPGEHTQPWPQSSGPSFLTIFYPSWSPDPNIGTVTPTTGLDDNWWRTFSVVAVCQAMSYITSDIRPQLKQPDIDNGVNATNATLRAVLNPFYRQLLTTISQSPASVPFAQIGSGNLPQAAQLYQGYLSNPAWIVAKNAQAASGQWTNQVWELYHHWIKLWALGLTTAQIDTLIGQLTASGLPVPAQVGPGAWATFLPWLTPGAVNYLDLGEATPGILQRICTGYMGGVSCMNEENCYEFTANSQPGTGWRQLPSGSCFLAGTKVLMGDDSLKNIEAVVVNDVVKTRTGTAQVLAPTVLSHMGEQTYSLNALGFQFTRTHPFMTMHGADGTPGPQMACVSPIALMNTCPSLGALGIAPLVAGCPALAGFANGAVQPVVVASLEEYPVTPGSIDIYDLVVSFDAEGLSEYIVGDGTSMFVVTSETPRFGVAPAAATVLLSMVNTAWPAVESAMADVTPDRWVDVLYQGVFASATSLVAQAIAQVQASATAPAPTAPGATLETDIAAHAAGTVGSLMLSAPSNDGPPIFDGAKGAFFAAVLAIFGEEVDDALNVAWRVFTPVDDSDAELLAVTALSYELIATSDVVPQGQLNVSVALSVGGAVTSQADGQVPLAYASQIGTVAYVDAWRPVSDVDWLLTISFAPQSGGAPLFSASMPLPPGIDDGYRLFNLALSDASGNLVGQTSIDARPLTTMVMATELEAQQGWGPEQNDAFAASLATVAAQLLAQTFPVAVAPYLHPSN